MSRTNILITVDTEYSIGGYFQNPAFKPVPSDRIIFCRIGEKTYGIALIMDILEHFGLKGIFFVEVEARFYFGDKDILKTIEYIQNRGHDVQLHTHPNFRTFKEGHRTPDDFRKYELADQKMVLEEALHFLNSNGLNSVVAHRSGGFYSNLDTLEAQRAAGIKFSSNYNLAFPNCDYIENFPLLNDISVLNGVFELPVTNYMEPELRKKWNSLQLSAASCSEIISVLNFAQERETRVITFITHSFEFVKANDNQYSAAKPLQFLIKRFEKFCKYLSENTDKFNVVTFNELERQLSQSAQLRDRQEHVFYKSTLMQTTLRYIENARAKII